MKNFTLSVNKPITNRADSYTIPETMERVEVRQVVDLDAFDSKGLLTKELNKLTFEYVTKMNPEMDETGGFKEAGDFYAFLNGKVHGQRLDQQTKDDAVKAVTAHLKKAGKPDNAIAFASKAIKTATVNNIITLTAVNPKASDAIATLLEETKQLEVHALWVNAMNEKKEQVSADDLL